MSAVQKTDYLPDAATLDLWRVAEEGDLAGLASVLPRVRDINARNEHGVTALMRAAQYGHVKMVRALLEHGADTNIKRNDKFTALALAAFFGHTEIVRALMEHGADLQAATRYDTSPHMWATARTFNEVVNQLEKPAPVEKPAPPQTPQRVVAPVPVTAVPAVASAPVTAAPASVSTDRVVRAVVKTSAVRTLSDPPEIWDLVHEVPRGFNARSAFLNRLKSFNTGWAFRVAAIAVLISASAIGVMVLRGVQARNEGNLVAPAKKTSQPQIPAPTAPTVAAPSFVAPEANNVDASEAPTLVNRKPASRSWRATHRIEQNSASRVAASETVLPITTPTAKASPQEPEPKAKASTPLSSQMIAPAKNATPKGKVIQWP